MAGNTTQFHNLGEEYILKALLDLTITPVTSIEIGLFDDSTDNLSANSDLADITTEPNDGNYARQTITLNSTNITVELNTGRWQALIAQQDFDTVGTTSSVDSYFVALTFQADGDATPTKHLIFSGDLDQTYDLTPIDIFRLEDDTAGLRFSSPS